MNELESPVPVSPPGPELVVSSERIESVLYRPRTRTGGVERERVGRRCLYPPGPELLYLVNELESPVPVSPRTRTGGVGGKVDPCRIALDQNWWCRHRGGITCLYRLDQNWWCRAKGWSRRYLYPPGPELVVSSVNELESPVPVSPPDRTGGVEHEKNWNHRCLYRPLDQNWWCRARKLESPVPVSPLDQNWWCRARKNWNHRCLYRPLVQSLLYLVGMNWIAGAVSPWTKACCI